MGGKPPQRYRAGARRPSGSGALDLLCACMRELGRFKPASSWKATTGVAKRCERDDDHCNDVTAMNITMPTSRIGVRCDEAAQRLM